MKNPVAHFLNSLARRIEEKSLVLDTEIFLMDRELEVLKARHEALKNETNQ